MARLADLVHVSTALAIAGCGRSTHIARAQAVDFHATRTVVDDVEHIEGSYQVEVTAAPEGDDPVDVVLLAPQLEGRTAGGQLTPFNVAASTKRSGPLPVAPGETARVGVTFSGNASGAALSGWPAWCGVNGPSDVGIVSLTLNGGVADGVSPAGYAATLQLDPLPPAAHPPPSGFAGGFGFQLGAGGYDRLHALALDAAGDLLVTGTFSGGADPTFPTGYALVKSAKTGTRAWSTVLPAPGIVVAGGDATIVAGSFTGRVGLGSDITSAGGGDVYVARFDAAGAPISVRSFGDAAEQLLVAVAAGGDGSAVLIGTDPGGTDFGGGPLPVGSPSAPTMFVAKLDAAGGHVFSRHYPGALPLAVATTAEGDVLVGGSSTESIDLGGAALGPGTFVMKLDPAGGHLWSRAIDGFAEPIARIAVAPEGTIVLALATAIVGLDASGAPLWSRQVILQPALSMFVRVRDLAIDGAGRILVAADLDTGLGDTGAGAIDAQNASVRFLLELVVTGQPIRSGIVQCTSASESDAARLAWRAGGNFAFASEFKRVAVPLDEPIPSAGVVDILLADIAP